ncbi:MAG: TolC family protein, partial [Pyrinomonadaceae bacterium]
FDLVEPFTIAPQTERPPMLDLTLSALTENAIRDRPDLRAALIGERIGSAKVRLARSQSVPDVAATVRYSRNKGIVDLPPTAGGGFATDRDSALTFGITFDIPVFNRNQGEIAAAASEQIQATRQREFLEATIKRDVAVAYRRYRAAAEKLVVYTTQILPRAEANLQTVRAAYALGDFSIFDVVAEQRRLNENVSGYNQVLEDYYTSLAELEAAVGSPLPPEAFVPGSTSVLPSTDSVPSQFTKEDFLKSLNREGLIIGSSINLDESKIQSIKKEKP